MFSVVPNAGVATVKLSSGKAPLGTFALVEFTVMFVQIWVVRLHVFEPVGHVFFDSSWLERADLFQRKPQPFQEGFGLLLDLVHAFGAKEDHRIPFPFVGCGEMRVVAVKSQPLVFGVVQLALLLLSIVDVQFPSSQAGSTDKQAYTGTVILLVHVVIAGELSVHLNAIELKRGVFFSNRSAQDFGQALPGRSAN